MSERGAGGLVPWLAGLRVPDGDHAGQGFTLLDWQREVVDVLERDDVQEIAISLPRGAGKSTFLGAVGAAAVLGPLARPNGESVVVAASTKQARAVYAQAQAFVEQVRPGLKGMRYMNAHYGAFLKDEDTGASLATISSDPKKAHGLRPVFVIADEPSSWSAGWGAEMIATLRTALGKASFAKLVLIGTRSADPEHFFSRALGGESDHVILRGYEGSDWADDVRAAVLSANPDIARPQFASLLARCVKEGEQAARDPTAAASFRALRLNAGVAPTPQEMLIESDVWLGIEVDEADLPAREGPSHWGIDLGGAKAMSGVASYWPATGRLEAAGWFPGEPSLLVRGRADNVSDRYERMHAAGELHLAGDGLVPDLNVILAQAIELFGRPTSVALDRWRFAEMQVALGAVGLAGAVHTRGMGLKDGGEDVRRFQARVLGDKVRVRRSLLLRSAFAEARVQRSSTGTCRIATASQAGRRAKARDDVAVASVLAIAEGDRVRRPTARLLWA